MKASRRPNLNADFPTAFFLLSDFFRSLACLLGLRKSRLISANARFLFLLLAKTKWFIKLYDSI